MLAWNGTYQGSCETLVFPMAIIAVIWVSVMEFSTTKRQCLARAYFVVNSLPYRLFNSKKIVFIKSVLLSVLLGGSLVLASVGWNSKTIAVLFADIFFLRWIYGKTLDILTDNLKEAVKYTFAKNIAVSANSVLLMAAIVMIEFYSPIPAYIAPSLNATLTAANGSFTSECNLTHFLLKVGAEKSAFQWWAMLHIDAHIHDPNVKLAAWVVFLTSNGLAAYAYGRYIVQLIDFCRLFGEKP